MRKLKFQYLFLVGAVAALAWSCNKELDQPPVSQLHDSDVTTIDSLRSQYYSTTTPFIIEDSLLSIYVTVTMDEVEGNIYKNLYVQDATGPANIRLTSSSDYKVGDSLRISLFGVEISDYNGVFQINNVDPDKNIVKQASGKEILPTPMSFAHISAADEGKLIIIENVQFTYDQLGNTYADAITQSSENRYLEDCEGNSLYIRTSGFADFAGTELPSGNGSITCIVSVFGSDIQLLVRSESEVNMSGARCPGQLVVKDFEDNSMTSGGWSVVQVTGTDTWETGSFGGSVLTVISNYDGSTNNACESWLISPSLDLSNSTGSTLSFMNTQRYGGDDLEVLISTDYTGTGDPNGATWNALPATLDTDGSSWDLVPSGLVDLSGYLVANVHIAFKYTGTDSDGKTWELDDIIITG
ncbi:MAG: DUF5689 domain-containing protein [Crocinitomicaceae bacterium]|nr:DUF5689 domain-containing protein [Crocinitomicaceae bacterium]